MVPDKFNMVDMGGIDLIMMQGEEVSGLYNRLVESIAQCRYQCLYNWLFDGVIIPPTYVELEVNENDEVAINEGVTVSEDDVIHIYSIEPPAPEPEIIPLLAEENGVYNVPTGKDGFNPVTVDVPSYTPVINPISITENGVYSAPVGVDGYSPITVSVASGGFELSSQDFEVGALDGTVNARFDSLRTSSSTRIRIIYPLFINSNNQYRITCNSGYYIALYLFNATGKSVVISGVTNTWLQDVTIPTGYYYFGFTIRNADSTAITPSDYNNADISITTL